MKTGSQHKAVLVLMITQVVIGLTALVLVFI